MSKNDLETYSVHRANDILQSIREFRVKIVPTKMSEGLEISRIETALDEYDEAKSNNTCISEETAKIAIMYYNRLLSQGAIVENQISQKQFEELQTELENEKKKRYRLEGRLEEYRRKYEGDDTFESEVIEGD